MAEMPELLLHDLAWMKRLATTLARDRDDAEDLVQETWIAAWRRSPDPSRPLRPWLAKVVRDLASMKHRSTRRRAARDAHANRAEAAAAPDEALAQLRLHQRLVELVLALDEPYRSTIIARFVEGRTSAAIAASLGIPAGTVRKRQHEALARLRAGLDAETARSRWAPAALAFAQGGMLVAKQTKLVVIVLAVLLLALATTVAVVRPWREDPTSAAVGTTHASEAARTAPAPASRGIATANRTAERTAPARSTAERAAARAAMLAAITKAREARDGRADANARTGAVPIGGGGGGTKLDIVDKTGDTSAWSQRALGTLNELMGECYDLGRAEDPKLAGTFVVQFRLVGEPGIGGLLERVDIIDGESTLSQETLRACVTEQLYALELDPPPDGVAVERQLSLKFP